MGTEGDKRKRSRIADEQSSSNSLNLASLPEDLLCHIFSYFTSRELVSTVCLVSKRWHRLGKSCLAILDYSVEPLLSIVDQIEVDSIGLSTSIPIQLSRRLQGEITQFNHVMKSLAKHNFSELFLHFVNIKTMPSVLNNSNFLSVLHLTDCQFPNLHFSAVPTLFSLQQLLLYNVVIEHSQDFFLNLSQKCPYIVELTLTNCTGCEYIDLPDGQYNKLKKLRVHNSYSKYSLGYGYSEIYMLQRVRIAALNLERFYLYYNGKYQIDLDIVYPLYATINITLFLIKEIADDKLTKLGEQMAI
ncbi:uncharacterized protein [Nicotiana tomentosiformis]|uniref:uncharacterized protein n=1 Tax=Nicotiana tomentosiformis TaxID=4098 RepID=UPI00388C50DF